MLRTKPQFERVPVALAKKILADELKRKQAMERLRGSTNKKLNTPTVAEIVVDD
ncbi:MAG: hypothetical protein WBL50_16295 [Candidatus Acidiferrum sp.]